VEFYIGRTKKQGILAGFYFEKQVFWINFIQQTTSVKNSRILPMT
jgi:hypothetical protein